MKTLRNMIEAALLIAALGAAPNAQAQEKTLPDVTIVVPGQLECIRARLRIAIDSYKKPGASDTNQVFVSGRCERMSSIPWPPLPSFKADKRQLTCLAKALGEKVDTPLALHQCGVLPLS